ncbi:MAG: DUF624 domain-containing protein [Butyricicoccus sp.]
MFRPSYLKEGPGVAKDAPEKTGAAWVGETLAREFWQLVKLNVLFLLCCLPVVTFGAARAAMARCTVNMARDVPNDVWTDFRAALRQDTVRNLLCGLAELALLWMGVMLVTADGFFPALLGMLLLCVTAAFSSLGSTGGGGHPVCGSREKCVAAVSAPSGMTVLGLGVNALLLIPAVLFFPLSLPYVLLFPCGLSGFASGMIGWSSCKRYLIR